MRFFVTGSVQNKDGPRNILLFGLLFLFLFVVIYGIREWLTLGITPTSISKELHKLTEFGEKGPIAAIESLHIDSLLFTMAFIFLSGVLYQMPFSQKEKSYLFTLLFLVIITYPMAKLLTYFWTFFSIITLISGIILHVFLISLIIFLLICLLPLPSLLLFPKKANKLKK